MALQGEEGHRGAKAPLSGRTYPHPPVGEFIGFSSGKEGERVIIDKIMHVTFVNRNVNTINRLT